MAALGLLLGWMAGARTAAAQYRPTIVATGSSTVAPFTTAVGQVVSERGEGRVDVRVVGTLGGYAEFCQGAALRYPDLQNASRRMTMAEFTHCASRGVHEIIELPIGYDGIVVAHARGEVSPGITLAQLWRGLAQEVPVNGRLVPNPYTRWREVAETLPDWTIRVIGPPTTSGTRDSFLDLVMLPGCQGVSEMRGLVDPQRLRRACTTLRTDGRWQDGTEDDEATLREVTEGPSGTLGIFGFSLLEANSTRVEGMAVEGVDDTRANIASGRYPLARPLYLYVKRPNLEQVPGLRDFLAEYLSDAAMGPEGYLLRRGLVPLDPARIVRARQVLRDEAIILRRPEN